MKRRLFAGLAGSLLSVSAVAHAQTTLSIGDPAPALSVAEWVKGSQIDKFDAGSVYLVEFWATW